MNDELIYVKEKINEMEHNNDYVYQLFIVGSVLREGTQSVYDDCDPKEIPIDQSVQDWLLGTTKALLEDVTENYQVLNIREVDEESETIKRYIEINNLNQLYLWTQRINNEQVENDARTLINRDDFKPKVLLAKLEIDDEMKVYFLKIINESVFLKKRKILEVVDRGDYQISQERDKKLFLDDQWDGIIIGNNVLLYNENKILSLFRYYERFRQAADEIVEQIMEKGIVSDDSNFLQFVQSQISLQKKLAKAADYGLERIKRERIEELINTGMINLQLDEQGRIVCTTKEEARLVIDVILDNFVSSLITDDKYRAINKMRIQ
ncbi:MULTISPECIES: Kiwa anti-phage protein KwaB-like domain-containing protein [Anoxybacillaceae]|uniref:DUF4868 domain-containing protein n=10 Tax=Anoxybacillaceae TaxID=3120669 RepID=Q5L2E3_GEOKA|nr:MULTISPECIES: Kiwa anti-phage protein KwaB-like domain-containing protein [Bacillaceae]AEV17990.1 hypothetical protein GTCCBUS3UF5_6670 [Geobacillus thermoleovorans CCB_US3_UF5]EQB94655.1 hypothetical protein GA8_15050 [Geobacillus sp. A8]KDE50141.1 hypothetical protein DI44_01690 [Geobacillus sp. CAMR5420]MED4973895.1 DUF4868 domain-containing protein [Geobacillus thermoleovorans]OKO91053.1 hypothetical protein BRO54_2910 [Geobacillus proteiniphilus]